MPARSEKQRRALIARFGIEWVRRHHFDKVVAKKKPPRGKGPPS